VVLQRLLGVHHPPHLFIQKLYFQVQLHCCLHKLSLVGASAEVGDINEKDLVVHRDLFELEFSFPFYLFPFSQQVDS